MMATNKNPVHLLLLCLALVAACTQDQPSAPSPAKRPVTLELHGDTRVDDYFWLRERDNPDVVAYLEAENAYTEKMLEPFKGLQGVLNDEMKARLRQDDESAPYRRGEYFYYYRYVEGSEYPIYARRKGSIDATEEILLDVNKLAGDADYFSLVNFNVNPDQRIAAYAVDDVGRRFYDVYFLDLQSGQLLPDRIDDTTANFEWANDSRTLLYGKQHPDTLRSYRVFRHTLGAASDTLVYEETDETNYLYLTKSLSYFLLLPGEHADTVDRGSLPVSEFTARQACRVPAARSQPRV